MHQLYSLFFFYGDLILQMMCKLSEIKVPEIFEDWFPVRNIRNDEALANFAKISRTKTKGFW